MEIFLEFVLAIAFSLIFSFFLAKLISVSTSSSPKCEYDIVCGNEDLIQKVVTCERGSEWEKREDEDLGESKQENILLQGILDDFCGSYDDVKIDENENALLKEAELPNFMERIVGDLGCAYVCSESENFAQVETDSTKDEMGVAKGEEIEVLESKCGYEICEANKNEEDEYGCKCIIFDCDEMLVDKSNFFESEKTVKIEVESTKTEACMTRSEEMVVLNSDCDDEIDEANKIEEDFGKSIIFNSNEKSMDKRNFIESENIAKIESIEVGMARCEEIEVLESKCGYEICEGNKNEEDDIKEVLFDEDDDWEGIERTELERLFGAAVAFVGNKCNADQISSIPSDVKMQLYGLHKIATVGPCHESQPMALKVSARANWNAWKQLGNMTPEFAMEQYVTILSRIIPGCIQDDIGGDIKQVSADAEACGELASDLKAYKAGQLGAVDKRNVDDLMPRVEGF